ncbi:MAG: uncharacterized LabA/DUF88 family protein [Verrucomicrobiales bacterium]|jgi:uncharacterized LabA/DUF88 family protein
MPSDDHEPRIAVYLDYENLAIGARENLGRAFDFGPVADALAERGRVITRKAYADWSYFDSDRRMLTRHQVELIDIPQKMGGSRKNAADIKMAIDAIELALDRDYISTFVICTGDSDLSPLVQKLRELDRQVIGVGVRQSTSKLLPPACDEFMFYDNLVSDIEEEPKSKKGRKSNDDGAVEKTSDISVVISTLAGLSSSSGTVRSSSLKRALLRKDPTFSEAELGFRNFGALLASLADKGQVELTGSGDPDIALTGSSGAEVDELLTRLVKEEGPIALTGLKTALRKRESDFSERNLGYRNFNSFVTAAEARGIITVTGEADGRMVAAPSARRRR